MLRVKAELIKYCEAELDCVKEKNNQLFVRLDILFS